MADPDIDADLPPVLRLSATARKLKRPPVRNRTTVRYRAEKPKKSHNSASNLVRRPLSEKVVRLREKKEKRNAKVEGALEAVWNIAVGLSEDPELDGESPNDWYDELVQKANAPERAVNTWNAFVREKMLEWNAKYPPGAKRPNIAFYIKDLKVLWGEMTKLEKIDAVKDATEDLEEHRKMRRYSAHNKPAASMQDVSSSVMALQREVTRLHHRTGVEVVLFVVRNKGSAMNHPHVFTTSHKADEFFKGAFGSDTSAIALQYEGYVVSGVEGLHTTQQQDLVDLQGKTAALIRSKLIAIAHPDSISRMLYASFESSITEKYGIVVDNWPLHKFCSPSAVKQRIDVETLFQCWSSGATRFRRLSSDEFQAFRKEQHEKRVAATAAAAEKAGVEPPLTVPSRAPSPVPANTAPAIPATNILQDSSSAILNVSAGAKRSYEHVMDVSTSALTVAPKKPRKKRSDAGVPRGSYKNKEAAAAAAAAVAAEN